MLAIAIQAENLIKTRQGGALALTASSLVGIIGTSDRKVKSVKMRNPSELGKAGFLQKDGLDILVKYID